jgi:Flp pilus assembly protein TadD
MTLNITIVTERRIYQSADYRLVDWNTGEFADFQTQKIVPVDRFGWSATVCFAGVGRARTLNVGDWLVQRIADVQLRDPFQRLLDELLKADEWLVGIPPPFNLHSFSVGAFIGSQPVFALVSNFEGVFTKPASVASQRLSISECRPTEPKTFVAGQRESVGRPQRRRLAQLADKERNVERMYAVLAEVNRSVAAHNYHVSSACFTISLQPTGEGGGAVHDLGGRPFMPTFAFPPPMRESIRKLLDEQFGPGRGQLRSMTFWKGESTDEFHRIQLREKPDDPNTHSNYGAFLKVTKGDVLGAERAYLKALELKDDHANALGNLANLLWERRDLDQSEHLYRRAVNVTPPDENISFNFARFLSTERGDRSTALSVIEAGLRAHPESARLLLLRGELTLLHGDARDALESFVLARERGANRAATELGYACALHMSGGPIGQCIGAYRVAIAANPENGFLRLNLSQLMFLNGEDPEALRQLREAMKLGLDDSAQLEAQFYLLVHTDVDPSAILRRVKPLLASGARLSWNLVPNIEKVSDGKPETAAILHLVTQVMAGDHPLDSLDELLARFGAGWDR